GRAGRSPDSRARRAAPSASGSAPVATRARARARPSRRGAPARRESTRRVLRFPPAGHDPVVQEPGLDRHEWESQWSDLEERLRDDPGDALFELDDLVARMLESRGLPLGERDGETDVEPETVREFTEARRGAELVGAGEDVDPGDIAHAI